MLEYSLYDNHFTTDNPEDRLARPENVNIRRIDELIEQITGPGSILKPTETEAVIENYWATIAEYISRGEAYSDDYIRTQLSIRGIFEDDQDRFDPTRHQVQVSVVLKESITEATGKINLQKIDRQQIAPEIETVYDWGSGTNDHNLTPGDVLEITGTHLKIHDNVEGEGVYFVSRDDDSEAKTEQIRTNEPKTLTLRIPEGLTAGTYRIEVRNSRYDGDELRTGIFQPVLTVE